MKTIIRSICRKSKEKKPDNSVKIQDIKSQSELRKMKDDNTEAECNDFDTLFLKPAKISDRRQVYMNGEFYDKISSYLHIISDGKVSMVGYIHNVLAHHMQEFRETINEMYQNKINKSNPL